MLTIGSGLLGTEMTQEYRLDREASMKYLYKVLFQITLFVVVALGGYILYNRISDTRLLINVILGVLGMWGLLYLFPLLILYFNHKRHSKGVVFKFDQGNSSVFFESKNHRLSIPVKDITKVELFLSPASYTNFIDWQYFGIYHYASLLTKENGVIKISCLVCDKIEDIFPKDVIHRKKRYMPIIWTSNKNTVK